MVVLLSLISMFCCYASENEITRSAQLLEKAQTYYYNYQKVYYRDNKIHFYNPVDKITESFNSNDWLENLFSTLPQQSLSNITATPKVQKFFNKNQPFSTVLNQLTELLTSINDIDYGKNNNKIKKEMLYYLKLLFYNLQINENKESSVKMVHYKNFLALVGTYIPATYNTYINSFQRFMFFMNGGFGAIMLTSEILLSVLTQSPEIILPVMLGPQALIHCTFLSAYLKTHSSYKKYCKTIENITKEVVAHDTPDVYLDIDKSE